VNRIMIQKD